MPFAIMSETPNLASRGVHDLNIDSYIGKRCVPRAVLEAIKAGEEVESSVFEHQDPKGRFWSMCCMEDDGPNHEGLIWNGSSNVPSEEHKDSASSYIIQTRKLKGGSWCITNQEITRWVNGEEWKFEGADLVGSKKVQTPLGELAVSVDDTEKNELGEVTYRVLKPRWVGYVREEAESAEGRLQSSDEVVTLQYRRWLEETETKHGTKTEMKVCSELQRDWGGDRTDNCVGDSTCASDLFGWDEAEKAYTLSEINKGILEIVGLM